MNKHLGLIFGLSAAVMNSISALFVKFASHVPFETMVFVRFFIAFLFLLPAVCSGKVHLHVKYLPRHLVRGLMGLISIYCFFYSIRNLALVNAVTLSNTTPLFMPIVVYFWLKLIIPKQRFWGLILGFVGVILILRPGPETEGIHEWAIIVGLFGALASAFALVGVRQLSKTESTETIMAYYFLISMAVLFIPMLFSWENTLTLTDCLNLVLIGASSAIYQFCITKALTHTQTTKVGTLSYLSVIFSGLFGWWFFQEVPNLWLVAGVAFIIGGGIVALLSHAPPRKRS